MQTINAQLGFPLSPEELEERKHEAVELLRCAADAKGEEARDVAHVALECDASLYTYSVAVLWLEHVTMMWSCEKKNKTAVLEAALILEGVHGTQTHAVRRDGRRARSPRRNAATARR